MTLDVFTPLSTDGRPRVRASLTSPRAKSPPQPGGRPRGFDKGRVLDHIADLFDRHGYEGMSINDLAAEVGLNHPSLYAAFGPKSVLFRMALDTYAARWKANALLVLGAPVLEQALVGLVDQQCRAFQDRRGCMLSAALQTSAASHGVEAKHAIAVRLMMVRTLQRRLDRAVSENELAPNLDTRLLATCLCGVIHGMSTLARDGAGSEVLSHLGQSGFAGLLARAASTDTDRQAA